MSLDNCFGIELDFYTVTEVSKCHTPSSLACSPPPLKGDPI